MDIIGSATRYYKVSYGATFAYCGLLTLCVSPFILFSSLRIETIAKIRNSKFLKALAWITFLYFILYVIISLPLLIKVLTGNIAEIRADHYSGINEESTAISSLPFIIRLPFTFLNLFLGCPWILIFLGFYSLIVQGLNTRYLILFFVASLFGIIQNIAQAGRSDTVYWLFSFGACYVFFQPFMTKNQIKKIKKFALFLIGVFMLYLLASTISRFSSTDESTQGGLVGYAGQSFVNFCYFYDNFKCPLPSLQMLFPFTYLALGISMGGIVDYQETLSFITGEELGVFYTFMGQIAVTSSNQIMIIYCLLLTLFSFISAIKIKKGHVSLLKSYLYLLFSSVLFLGLFSHFYGLPSKTFSAVAFAFIFARLRSVKKSTSSNRLKQK